MTPVSAATKRVEATEKKNAEVLKECGTYKLVNCKDNQKGYVIFKAPKAGKYSFNFDKLFYAGEYDDSFDYHYWEDVSEDSEFDRMVKVVLLKDDKILAGRKLINDHCELRMRTVYIDSPNLCATYEDDGWSLQFYDEIFIEVAPKYKKTVELKKGEKITIRTTGDFDKTYMTFIIKEEK